MSATPLVEAERCTKCGELFQERDRVVVVLHTYTRISAIDVRADASEPLVETMNAEMDWNQEEVYHEHCYRFSRLVYDKEDYTLDNRDIGTTELVLDNGSIVRVDPWELLYNALENAQPEVE